MLVYSAITSLDGYVVDASGSFAWSAPDEEVHAHVNDRDRSIGTYLLGRRMYEVLLAWEDMPTAGAPEVVRDYAAQWAAKDKVVFSRTLSAPRSARTRVVPSFSAAAVRALVEDAPSDVSIGGPTLAAAAFEAGLVSAVSLYVNPVSVGGGTPALPPGLRVDLTPTDSRRFTGGVVFLRYRLG
jgi:dihydrofolate reductase